MIEQALRHLSGIGPRRVRGMAGNGLCDWYAIEACRRPPPGFGNAGWERVRRDAGTCIQALESEDILFLARRLAPSDRWRILDRWIDRAVFFDIETAGLEPSDEVTLAACLRRESLQCFIHGENLDDLLEVLDQAPLLVTFNGTGFDLPRITRHFNIPELRCPHVDLRWICHHHGFRGGLKRIEEALSIRRPEDLCGLDGAQAVTLWRMWRDENRREARDLLARYCCADVVGLRRVALRVAFRAAGRREDDPFGSDDDWQRIDQLYPTGENGFSAIKKRLEAERQNDFSTTIYPAKTGVAEEIYADRDEPCSETRLRKRKRLARMWRARSFPIH